MNLNPAVEMAATERKERRERSLRVTLRKNFAHFAVKNKSFLLIVAGL